MIPKITDTELNVSSFISLVANTPVLPVRMAKKSTMLQKCLWNQGPGNKACPTAAIRAKSRVKTMIFTNPFICREFTERKGEF